ncbi:hypothetical protein [Mangrovicoccus algicola]|uniref:Lipoprotein n=1 Tax=Mangrovicoccus algicola TaxID=2771008 RepID=A0A8J7CMG1_9RHOB|nr:hypothetical protein [Mangrovicoccus algicola]MBE3640396.1 hypothetical protein [Mangrovicoccus algicola]
MRRPVPFASFSLPRLAGPLLAMVVLAGCATQSLPLLHGGKVPRVSAGGSEFVVRYTATRAEATRVSPESRPRRMVMLARALEAIETASGCRVLPGTLYGDWSLAEAYLDCPGTAPQVIRPVLTHRPPIAPG